jgi:hypothetical protein
MSWVNGERIDDFADAKAEHQRTPTTGRNELIEHLANVLFGRCSPAFATNEREEILRAFTAHEALFSFAKEIAAEHCYRTPGEYPEAGEDGHAPCRSCQARETIAQAEGVR